MQESSITSIENGKAVKILVKGLKVFVVSNGVNVLIDTTGADTSIPEDKQGFVYSGVKIAAGQNVPNDKHG